MWNKEVHRPHALWDTGDGARKLLTELHTLEN